MLGSPSAKEVRFRGIVLGGVYRPDAGVSMYTGPQRLPRILTATALAGLALATAGNVARFTGSLEGNRLLYLLYLAGIVSFFLVPLAIILQFAWPIYRRIRLGTQSTEPLWLTSVTSGMLTAFWIVVAASYWLVPLFLSENRVQRSFVDAWLDKL